MNTLYDDTTLCGTQTFDLKNHAVFYSCSVHKIVDGKTQYMDWITPDPTPELVSDESGTPPDRNTPSMSPAPIRPHDAARGLENATGDGLTSAVEAGQHQLAAVFHQPVLVVRPRGPAAARREHQGVVDPALVVEELCAKPWTTPGELVEGCGERETLAFYLYGLVLNKPTKVTDQPDLDRHAVLLDSAPRVSVRDAAPPHRHTFRPRSRRPSYAAPFTLRLRPPCRPGVERPTD